LNANAPTLTLRAEIRIKLNPPVHILWLTYQFILSSPPISRTSNADVAILELDHYELLRVSRWGDIRRENGKI